MPLITPPPLWVPPAPAIVRPQYKPLLRVGLEVEPGKVEYQFIDLPRDWPDARRAEDGRTYIRLTEDLQVWLPTWCFEAMLFAPGFRGSAKIKTVVFLTGTSSSNQSWSVLGDWNSADNWCEVLSHAAHGSDSTGAPAGVNAGAGGGGGGYALSIDVSLTPGGTATYRLRAANSGGTDATACWFNGTSLAGSSVGIRGASGQTGASTTNGVGSTKRSGGSGGFQATSGLGGGGAAGRSSNGGTATGSSGGAAGSGSFDGSHAPGKGGNGSSNGDGSNGALYAGGGGAAGVTGGGGGSNSGGSGRSGLICLTNNVSL